MNFSPSLHDVPINANHEGWHTDINPWTRGSSQVMRGHLTKYTKDEKGRTRWHGESRDGAKYENVEIFMPAGSMTAPKVGDNNEVVFITLDGDHSQVIGVPIGDSEKRQKIDEGWTGMAQPDDPSKHFQIDDNGNAFLRVASLTIEAPSGYNIKANIKHTGDMDTTGVHTDSIGKHDA